MARVKALSRPGALAALSAKAAAGRDAPAGAAPQMALAEAAPAAETGFIRQQRDKNGGGKYPPLLFCRRSGCFIYRG